MTRFIVACAVVLALASTPARAYRLGAESTAMRVPSATTAGRPIDVLVLDNRADVVNGDRHDNYEGVSRQNYGIPVAERTYDRTPLASYLGERLRIGFERAGYAPRFVPSPPGSTPDAFIGSMAAQPARAFVVDLHDWHYDYGGLRPSFFYDVTVLVYDARHQRVASQDFKGEATIALLGWKDYKTRYAELYQTVFDGIFAAEAIHRALGDAETEVAPAAPVATGQ